MRSTDRALSNIEAHPDGFNALRRMYTTVQQPLFDACGASAHASETPSAPSGLGTPGVMNTCALPNPWAPRLAAPSPLFGMGPGALDAPRRRQQEEEERRRRGL
jgi:ubiquilin